MNFSKIKIDKELKEIYGESLYLYQNDDDWKINVLFYLSDYETLLEKWSDVSSAVSAIYQSDLVKGDDFEKWNLYLIYICSEPVTKDLKTKIENNKFSSRKIVELDFGKQLTDRKANEFIIKHITNTDLVDIVNNTIENTEGEYISIHSDFWKLIPSDDSLNRKTELQRKILQQFEIIEKNEN